MIRVVIADDHHIFRQGLLKLLTASTDVKVVADTGDGSEALGLIVKEKPDMAILDITLPGLSGFEVARRAKRRDYH